MTAEPKANAEQAEYWNADEAAHWVSEQDCYDAMLAPFATRLLGVAALDADADVLDVGCGTGTTTCDAARAASDGTALGVDLSQPMIEAARARATRAGLDNAEFEVADAQTHRFAPGSADVVISRFGVMFFDDPVAAFANVRAALRDDGRLVFVCWQDMLANEWMAVPALAATQHVPLPDLGPPDAPGPFSLGDADHVRTVLEDAGFSSVAVDALAETIPLGGARSLDEAVTFLLGSGLARRLFADADEDAVERATEAVVSSLEPHVTTEGVMLGAAGWVVTAAR